MTTRETIIGILGLIGLWGCSGETVEPSAEQQAAICLAGGLPDEELAVTRATEKGLEEVLTTDKTFKAWGYKNDAVSSGNYTSYQSVMPGYVVSYGASTAYTTTSNTRDWEYVGQGTDQDIKYWDFAAEAYRFFAYAPSSANLTPDTSNPAQVSFTANVNASTQAGVDAAPYFSELWFSRDKVNDYGKPVTLRFIKPFARVRFMFIINEDLAFTRVSLNQIQFGPTQEQGVTPPTIATAGNVTVTYPLTGTGTEATCTSSGTNSISAFTIDYYPEDLTVTPADPNDPAIYPNSPEHWYYVLPATSQGSFTVQVAVETGEVKKAVVPAEYMSWKAGYEYTYKFKMLDGGKITIEVIEVGIKNWGATTEKTHTVYNW